VGNGKWSVAAAAGKKNLCIIALPALFLRASVALTGKAAKLWEFKLARGWRKTPSFRRRKRAVSGAWAGRLVFANALPAMAITAIGGGLRAFSRIKSGNSELYRRLRKNVAVARCIVDNCRSAKSPSERGTYG
jgi:hypothetical protein